MPEFDDDCPSVVINLDYEADDEAQELTMAEVARYYAPETQEERERFLLHGLMGQQNYNYQHPASMPYTRVHHAPARSGSVDIQ